MHWYRKPIQLSHHLAETAEDTPQSYPFPQISVPGYRFSIFKAFCILRVVWSGMNAPEYFTISKHTRNRRILQVLVRRFYTDIIKIVRIFLIAPNTNDSHLIIIFSHQTPHFSLQFSYLCHAINNVLPLPQFHQIHYVLNHMYPFIAIYAQRLDILYHLIFFKIQLTLLIKKSSLIISRTVKYTHPPQAIKIIVWMIDGVKSPPTKYKTTPIITPAIK